MFESAHLVWVGTRLKFANVELLQHVRHQLALHVRQELRLLVHNHHLFERKLDRLAVLFTDVAREINHLHAQQEF